MCVLFCVMCGYILLSNSFTYMLCSIVFVNVTSTTEIYTDGHPLYLHDALPISGRRQGQAADRGFLSLVQPVWLFRRPIAADQQPRAECRQLGGDRKSTRLNSSH